jgi:WD40 repeat protein
MATGGTDSTVRVWDIRMGKQLQVGVGHSAKVMNVLSRSSHGSRRVHGPLITLSLLSPLPQVTSLQFSPDDKQLVSVGDDGSVFVWNVYM